MDIADLKLFSDSLKMPQELQLVELDTRARDFLKLEVADSQRGLVATMAQSYADALFPPDDGWGTARPWMRGVLVDGEPAGFIMCSDPAGEYREAWLWRLLVDKNHQRKGVGTFAAQEAIERYRTLGVTRILTGWVPAPGNAGDFYRKLGFIETGDVVEGEVIAALEVTIPSS